MNQVSGVVAFGKNYPNRLQAALARAERTEEILEEIERANGGKLPPSQQIKSTPFEEAMNRVPQLSASGGE